ncbi:type I secretion system permease/ATPase [Saccharophagus degradans]|uniref:Type I secretion system permease/ATPase n=1 Tax=Saccharophagus degradans TaxID=86304 RepID=A0AAW7X9J6_9GAMM|nr:type I secretion system permease/ATPase [Saccharophagus degradans]MDO6423049.1 type I secretion system permease/ATPase [Saccharophagus degradans]MDO6607194.1 type I secretion system permease/ATPase [Saccharophagus degradans]
MDKTEDTVGSKDPLLLSLMAIARYEHVPCSDTMLVSGLPLHEGRLTPELLVRAASRIDMKASVVERTIDQISNLVLPAILILKDNQALVLLDIVDNNSVAQVYCPEQDVEQEISIPDLLQQYTGLAIYIKPETQYEARALHDIAPKRAHWFWGTLSHSWRIYRDVLVASFLINLFALANPLFVMNVYDRVVPNNAIETLWVLALGVSVVYIFDYILKTLRVHFIEVAGKKSDVLLSAYIFERVLGAKYDQHPPSVGAFTGQLRDFDSVRNFITATSVTAFVDLPFTVLFLVVIGYLGGPIVWIPIVIIPLIIVFSLVVQAMLNKAVANTFVASAQKNATMVEAITNLSLVKVLNAEGKILRNLEKAVGLLAYWGVKTRVLSNSATGFAGFMQQMASVLVVIVGVYLISAGELTMGGLIACVLLTTRSLMPLAQVAGLLVQFQQSKMALTSLEEIVNRQQERPNDRHFIKRIKLQGNVEFKAVNFVYPGDDQPTLKDVSFSLKEGEKVALIGRLGSGKSTMNNLIAGLYQPTSGAILIDGIDIKQIDPAELRANLGYVPQDSSLFYGSIKENIAYRDVYVDDQEIIRVAEVAGVSAFSNLHPHGLARMIGERGDNLSGGQRQAISIARGLVNSPALVLLDEPTSAMDNASEAKLMENLKEELADKTVIMVTHKTSLLRLVDRVIVMDGGRIVADGPKDTVLEALKKGQVRVS